MSAQPLMSYLRREPGLRRRRAPVLEEFRTTKQYCDPVRGHMSTVIGTRRQRFEFALLPEESERQEAAWRLLERHHGLGPGDVTIIRQLDYTFEARAARRWRDQRVFRAGDAAPPTRCRPTSARALLGARSELRVWSDGEHTLYNYAVERDAVVADWFCDQLLPGRP